MSTDGSKSSRCGRSPDRATTRDRRSPELGEDSRCAMPADDRAGLSSRSFISLLATQTLGTLNDNMFRWLAVPVGTQMLGGTAQAAVAALSWGIFWFTLPYLLLPTHAGWLSDRFCKRDVIVWCKVAELVVMLLGLAAIF